MLEPPSDPQFDSQTYGACVLLVEDDYVQRTTVRNALYRDGYEVITAHNAEDAIRKMKEQLPDVILTDMCMRRATGLDLLNFIKSTRAYQDVPVILVSAFDDERAVSLAMQAGAADYLTKPISLAMLRARVKTAIRNGRALRDAKENAQVLTSIAERDELTGVYNRRHLMRLLKAEMSRSEKYNFPLSVLLLDIDHFKSVNDTYGHEAGDCVLHQFAQEVEGTMRTVDELCRIGGEEFCAVLILTELDDAELMAERIRQTVEQRELCVEGQAGIHISVSIGVATWRQSQGHSPANLLRRADSALYRAKAAGRNQVVCFGAQEQTPARLELQSHHIRRDEA